MAQKHLRELLQEDQEPFMLHRYIADRRCQIKRPSPGNDLQVKKRKPIAKNPRFPPNFCLFSSYESPDPRKPPLFDFKSPSKSPNRAFLNVPAKTASLLLEAAARIQKESSKNSKSKIKSRGSGLGLIGFVLKRLTRNRKPETFSDSIKETLRLEKQEKKCALETRFSSGGVWSESDEDDGLLDFEEANVFVYGNAEAGDSDSCENGVCERSFRFSLQTSPSGHRTPDLTSPARSPSSCTKEEKDDYGIENTTEKSQEVEDKEQCSPVSVLDPSFDDDEHVDDDDDDYDDDEEDEGSDLECRYEIVQRAKKRLMQKLRRFEELAGLDPIGLEKRMLEHEQGNYSDDENDICDSEEDEEEEEVEVMDESVSSDFITAEEKKRNFHVNKEITTRRVWKQLRSYKQLWYQTLDVMVEQDFRKELNEWKQNQEEVQETGSEIEFAIFCLLVEELSEELVSSGV